MTDDTQPKPTKPRRSWARWNLLTAVAILIIGAGLALTMRSQAQSASQSSKKGADQPTPVTVVAVKTQDVPVVLTGIGTVQASNTVTISPMVTGPIVAINFTEGQDVKTGDVIARIDPRTYQATLDQDKGKLAQDQATLAGAERDLARYNQLTRSSYEPQQTADDERATVAETKALIEQDLGAIEAAQTNLDYCTITAPVGGRLGIRNVDLGNIVSAGSSTGIVTLTTLQPIGVIFTLPQQDLPQIVDAAAGGKLPVSVEPEGNTSGTPETATLDVIDNQVDSSTGTIKFKAYFPNADLHLWPGGFVTAHLTVNVLKNALTVPPSAVQTGPTSSFVYVLAADNTVKQATVTLGEQNDTLAVIQSGLSVGDKVVLQGASRLNDGAKVKVIAPTGGTHHGTGTGQIQPQAPAQ